MKNIIKNFVPDFLLAQIRKYIKFKNLIDLYAFDKKRHRNNAYDLSSDYSFNNLKSKITFHYHSIEKGLSNVNLRLGFGKKAFDGLFFAMDKFIEKGYSTENFRFQQAISVIKEYVKLHDENNYPVENVALKLRDYSKFFNNSFNGVGGFGEFTKEELPCYEQLNFKELAMNRYSIRDFGTEVIEDKKIYEAIQISTKTPSVCNRQACKVYQIKNSEMIKSVFELQGGLTTNGKNLQQILLVTGNREFMNGPHERNQTYIDGGMFLMSLVYGLTYNKIASCVLNANFTLKKENNIRSLLNISYSEDIIAFVAIGSYSEVTKYAKSPRDNFEEITVVID